MNMKHIYAQDSNEKKRKDSKKEGSNEKDKHQDPSGIKMSVYQKQFKK
jgi:hypothetical protein